MSMTFWNLRRKHKATKPVVKAEEQPKAKAKTPTEDKKPETKAKGAK